MSETICKRCRGVKALPSAAAGFDTAVAVGCPSCTRVADCPTCEGTGFVFVWGKHGGPVANRCPDCAEVRKRMKQFDEALVPRHFWDAAWSDFERGEPGIRDAALMLRRRIDEGFRPGDAGVVLSGPPGLGKTRLLCRVIRALSLERGYRVRYVEFAHLLSELRAGFERGVGEGELIGELVAMPVLVIDELGKKAVTEWQAGILDEIISKRYNREVSTFFGTNLHRDRAAATRAGAGGGVAVATLADRIDDRIVSRIDEMARFVRIEGTDQRPKHRRDD